MSEREASVLAYELEALPIFAKVRRFVRRRPFRGTSYCLPFDENSSRADSGFAAIPWDEFASEIQLIRKIGQPRFEKYFLGEEIMAPAAAIAAACGIAPADVGLLHSMLIRLDAMRGEPAPLPAAHAGVCVAQISAVGSDLRIAWRQTYMARGAYIVDQTGLKKFSETQLDASEREALRRLLAVIAQHNFRANKLCRVLEYITEKQKRFLLSGRDADKIALSAKAVSMQAEVHPTTVSRILKGRTVVAPSGKEIALPQLLPSMKHIATAALTELAGCARTDRELQRLLRLNYGISLARRTVNAYKKGNTL